MSTSLDYYMSFKQYVMAIEAELEKDTHLNMFFSPFNLAYLVEVRWVGPVGPDLIAVHYFEEYGDKICHNRWIGHYAHIQFNLRVDKGSRPLGRWFTSNPVVKLYGN